MIKIIIDALKGLFITGMVSPPPEIDNEIAIIPLTDISAELSVEIELAIIEIQTENNRTNKLKCPQKH